MAKLLNTKIIFLLITTLCIFFFPLFNAYAGESTPILYWSPSCKYCLLVKEKMKNEGITEKVQIEYIQVNSSEENLKSFKEKLSICKISNAGIPMLFMDGKCFQGVDSIMSQLRSSSADGRVEMEQDHIKIDNRGKGNTEKMIVGITLFLIVLPILGQMLKNIGGKKDRKEGRKVMKVVATLLLLPLFTLLGSDVYAVCPVCTVAVGAGVGFSRYLGIDDVISGIWVGGLILSSALWLKDILKDKLKKHLKKRTLLKKILPISVFVLTFVLFIIPLKFAGIIGNELNRYYGIDKVILGILVGSLAFWFGECIHGYLLRKNSNRVYFPFQKVEIPIISLLIATIILYLIVYY